MKKILAAVLALTMVLSMAALANAADGKYAVFAITEADSGYDNATIAANFAIGIAPGDTVSFDYKVLNTDNYCSISVRGYDKPSYWFDIKSDNSIEWRIDGDPTSLAPVQESIKVEDLGDDWYRVSWTVGPETGSSPTRDGIWIRFEWDENAGGFQKDGDIIFAIDNMKAGSNVCTFDEVEAVEGDAAYNYSFKKSDGSAMLVTRKEGAHTVGVTIEGTAATGGDTTGGDTTGTTATPKPAGTSTGTSKTGVVSAAVIAAAAVLGGAVVLKKKEF